MAERLTKTGARNVFYGGPLFFFALFVGLTAHRHFYTRTTSTDEITLTVSVARRTQLLVKNSLLNRYPLLG